MFFLRMLSIFVTFQNSPLWDASQRKISASSNKPTFFFRARRALWIEYSNSPSRDVLNSNLVLFMHMCDKLDILHYVLLESVLDIGLQQYADPAYSLPYFNLQNPNFSNPFTKKYYYQVFCGWCTSLSFKVIFFENQLSQLQPFTASVGTQLKCMIFFSILLDQLLYVLDLICIHCIMLLGSY